MGKRKEQGFVYCFLVLLIVAMAPVSINKLLKLFPLQTPIYNFFSVV